MTTSTHNTTSEDTLKDFLHQALSKNERYSTREVERILHKRLTQNAHVTEPLPFAELWTLEDLGVSNVSLLKAAPQDVQTQVAHDLARARFVEAYAIEKAGMSFASKMSLMAPNLSEQQMYSLFATEEARHFHFIDQSLGHPTDLPEDPFIHLLHDLVLTGERQCLFLLVQVVLEGWGIDHYARMANTCQHPAARAELQQILADEAAHHGSGVALFDMDNLSEADQAYIIEKMSAFLYMVAIGPVGVAGVLEHHLGPMTSEQHQQTLIELDAHNETRRKLRVLRELMEKAGAHALVEQLEDRQAFALAF